MKRGLTSEEVKQRIASGYQNGMSEQLTRSYRQIVHSSLFTYFNFLNLFLFVLVLLTGKYRNGLFFMSVIVNSCIGIFQQIRAKKLLDRMSILTMGKIEVLRDGVWQSIPYDEIVLDDYVRIGIGQQLPVDIQLVQGNLEMNESLLTGEADVVVKGACEHVYSGTDVLSGHAEGNVIRVGKNCVAYQILEEAKKEKDNKSDLFLKLEKLVRILSFVLIPAGVLLFLTQFFRLQLSLQDATLKTIAAVVGMIPEGLVILTSVALAASAIRLAKEHVLVQDLFAIESLARVDMLCLDKTGTITSGNMEVHQVIPLGIHQKEEIHDIMGSYLSSLQRSNATDEALFQYFSTSDQYQVVKRLSFSSQRKYASAVLRGLGTVYLGAASALGAEGLDQYANEGNRVIVLGLVDGDELEIDQYKKIEIIACIILKDELRQNVDKIISYLQKQDVEMKILTGDNPLTASVLARRAGITGAENYVDLSADQRELKDIVEKYTVFGRVLPSQKRELVELLQQKNHVVAMVGDGVNDVPALKSADVSLSFSSGTAAAKDSSDIVLLDDDFAKIPMVVYEGRRVINNISKAASMYLVKTTFSLLLTLYVVLLGRTYPFLPIHLTIISAFGVGIPTFLLQNEPSFQRINQDVFLQALRYSIPSGVTVFLMAMICITVYRIFGLTEMGFYGLFISVTSVIYLYTLYRVYQPLTKYRILMIAMMGICLGLIVGLLGRHWSVEMNLSIFLDTVILGFLSIVVVECMGYVWNRFANEIQKLGEWFYVSTKK